MIRLNNLIPGSITILSQNVFPREECQATHLFPRPGAVSFARAIHSYLVLPQVHQGGGQARKIRHVIVEQLGRIVHSFLVAAITNLKGDRRTKLANDKGTERECQHGCAKQQTMI